MNIISDFKEELIRIKRRLKYEDARIRSNVHRKRTPLPASLSVLPANRLALTLREEIDYATYTNNMLSEADNIVYSEFYNFECKCSCHGDKKLRTLHEPVFHSAECVQECGESNDEYRHYLSGKIHTVQNSP
ncbi:hypothetical protein HG536_0G00140 [Torulaspora globosa]|uniref:Uncharacterized protein n=1 Tax=Torulaspora globosa TaxID=48254 RepID=A0A7G3ZKX2_9SACH|nr:uncharacterized protein HG536_0G00140 [Torulaspora globosa]QLL34158.1 hypothetical protein HG536_0G00140 [Torulaspora globosa]